MNYKFICECRKNESHSRREFKNHKKKLHHQFGAKVSTVWQMSHQNGIWHEPQVHLWLLQKRNLLGTRVLRITRKNFLINSEPRCLLHDKCHIKTEYDMNCKFICHYCKKENRLRRKLKNHKKKLCHQFGAKVCTVWQMSHQNRIWHEL